jgi:hypothetical protein
MSLLSHFWDLLTGHLHTRISEGFWRTEELQEQARIAQRQVDRLEKLVVTIQVHGAGGTWRLADDYRPPLDLPVMAVWPQSDEARLARVHLVASAPFWQFLQDGKWMLSSGCPKVWTDAPLYLLKGLIALPGDHE